mgnify:FL=1|jgi:hypothetical protein|tara:strand:- start:1231 stop:1614 length:384 start_codon:yes stop_codon:yes gene_type:complete
MKYLQILIIMLFASASAATEVSKEMVQLYGKPVPCGDGGIALDMWNQLYKDDMQPLLGFKGNSFKTDGSKHDTMYFVMYDAKDQQIAVVEKMLTGGTCLIAGGTGNVSFDTDFLNKLIVMGQMKDFE